MKNKKNLFFIEGQLVLDKIKEGSLIIVGQNDGRRKTSHRGSNIYLQVAGTNLVLVHIKNGYFIVINKEISLKDGATMNLVDELSKVHWLFKGSRVYCPKMGNRQMYQCIGSIMMYGDIDHRLPITMHVHHKWFRWCNAVETITPVCYRYHRYFHAEIGSQESHRLGVTCMEEASLDLWECEIKKRVGEFDTKEM